jgi:hypothetical protein
MKILKIFEYLALFFIFGAGWYYKNLIIIIAIIIYFILLIIFHFYEIKNFICDIIYNIKNIIKK